MYKEVKLLVDGREVKLTEEQIKVLFPEKKKSPFERAKQGEKYYVIFESGEIDALTERGDGADICYFNVANYCTDKKLMEQRALHETLDRLLWRYSCENGGLENEWDGKSVHYGILYDSESHRYNTFWDSKSKRDCIYFPSRDVAFGAIEEIIEPFAKEHPDFVW